MIIGMPVHDAGQEEYLEEVEELLDPVEDILAAQSAYDLDQWLKSPFWKVCMMMLDEQITLNQQDLLMGGIAERAKLARAEGTGGPLYESDDALRGGILAMTEMRDFPERLRQELEIARSSHNKDRGED